MTSIDQPHRRLNPLTGDYVLCSPHRALRPWQGAKETSRAVAVESFDPTCYLCPGNKRANGSQNDDYTGTYVFDNDFPALLSHETEDSTSDPLFHRVSASGHCEVICYSPDHRKTMADLDRDELNAVVDTWCDRTRILGQRFEFVQVFENKGQMMGCSNPHPHGQIWATAFQPNEHRKETINQEHYFDRYGRSLLLDYAAREVALTERVVEQNKDWVVVVPYWAAWPFETMLLPLKPIESLTSLNQEDRRSLASILGAITRRYDRLFETSFPYSFGWHGAPEDGQDHPHWQLHAHFYPPLLRSATVKKFMVGFELLAESQRDLTPEQAALKLRGV